MVNPSSRGATVSPSQTPVAGQQDTRPPERDAIGIPAGTANLKALARHVLARDVIRDKNRRLVTQNSPSAEIALGQSRRAGPGADRSLGTWGDAEEERAAIAEYHADIPRAWAEGFARLHPDHPPGAVEALANLRQ